MRCPHCNKQTRPGTHCEECGERLPKPSRSKLIVAAVLSVAVIAVFCVIGVYAALSVANRAPASVEVPVLSSDMFEEEPLTLEEEKALAREELAQMEAQTPDGSSIDQIVGYWKTDDYFVHIQKIATATYRWTSMDDSDVVYKMQINNDNRYVLTDDDDVTYIFGIEDYDSLKFYSVKDEDGGIPDTYSIPYKGTWQRTDENGNAIVRTTADEESFWIVGQKFVDVCKYYTADKAYYDDDKNPVVDMKNQAGTTFVLSFVESKSWSWSKKNSKELNLPDDSAVVKSIEAPLDFFLDSQKSSLTADEIAEVLPADSGSTPTVSQDSKTTVIKWERNSQKLTLTLKGTDDFELDDTVTVKLGN